MSQDSAVAMESEVRSRIDAVEVLDAAPRSEQATAQRFDSPERSAFLDALSVLLIPTVLLALVDAFGSTRALPMDTRQRTSGWLFVYVLPLFLAISVLASSAWALLHRLRARAKQQGLPSFGRGVRNVALAATLPVAAVACMLLFWLSHTAATRFNNHDLSALLVALVALAAACPLAILWLSLFVGLQAMVPKLEARRALSRVLPWLIGAPPLLLVLAWLVRRNASGFAILGGWLWLGPLVAAVGLLVSAGMWQRHQTVLRRPLRRVLFFVAPLSVAGAWLAAVAAKGIAEDAVRGGLWSGKLVAAGRVATDVDGDGTSSLFGGGDCAPWDPKIHPYARDIPGDGLDNNCFGGDAPAHQTAQGPRWYDDAVATDKSLNLLVVTIDASRADHFSAFGYGRPTTPHFDALARRSQLFQRAYSAANSTVMSLLSLLSARPPIQIEGGNAKAAPVWIPELLQRQGFRTAAVLTNWRRFQALDRGFDDFDTSTKMPQERSFEGFVDSTLIDKAIAFIDREDKRRFLLWTHLMAPHAPYERTTGAPDFGNSELDLYDSELWAADRELGRLIDHLDERGVLEHTIVIVSGDHGESLGDHGVDAHDETLFDSEVHTAGLLYLPHAQPRVVEQPVVHRDLITTAMNVLGAKRGFASLGGRNLQPVLSGFNLDEDSFFLDMATRYQGAPLKAAVIRWPFKLIYDVPSRQGVMFNLHLDPDEERNVATLSPTEFGELSQLVATHLEDVP